ncbi:MAG: hypothetical protein DMG03_25845 [Acidobacteria bacterium]|nr:MAG: hypothetical protein DMG03_25845 [Acidobacteriota bacterium]
MLLRLVREAHLRGRLADARKDRRTSELTSDRCRRATIADTNATVKPASRSVSSALFDSRHERPERNSAPARSS